MKVFAPAKVNLMLRVTGKRVDGYHDLQSVVVFADVGDDIEFMPAKGGRGLSLEVGGAFAHMVPGGDDNIALRAVRMVGEVAGRKPDLCVKLTKNLPVQAGLGGGSADAAAVLRGLDLYWGAGLPEGVLNTLARKLGADVPVCFGARARWMEGVGDRLYDVGVPSPLAAVLFWPQAGLSTPQMFGAITTYSPAIERPERVDLEWLAGQGNDFEIIAAQKMPDIARAIDMIKGAGASFARMSGSGSACFGVFASRDEAGEAAHMLRAAFPAAWVMPCYLNV